MPEQVAALRTRLDDEVKALQDRLKSLDAEWRADRGRLQDEMRALDRSRAEQRKALQRELRDAAATLREAPARRDECRLMLPWGASGDTRRTVSHGRRRAWDGWSEQPAPQSTHARGVGKKPRLRD